MISMLGEEVVYVCVEIVYVFGVGQMFGLFVQQFMYFMLCDGVVGMVQVKIVNQ